MAKAIAVCALCIASAAVGAAVDRYFAAAIEQGGPRLERAVTPKAAVAAPAEMNVEVLGDRVRCDIRYQELKILTPRSRIFCSAAPKKMPTPAPVVKNASVKKMIFDSQTERETSSAATSA